MREFSGQDEVVIGVVSDTHIPDRTDQLHPDLLTRLEHAGVDLILHAGDISLPSVIQELEKVAPVKAVQGNRDILSMPDLPKTVTLEIGKLRIAMMHGHGTLSQYLADKLQYYLQGYSLPRYQKKVFATLPESDVYVFGHTHHAVNQWGGKKLLFNPGSVTIGLYGQEPPSFGLLRIRQGGLVSAEIHVLDGYKLQRRIWQKDSTS